MNQDANPKNTPVRSGRVGPLLAADAFYMVLVFAWAIGLPPLGRDYAMMARPDMAAPAARRLFTVMMHCFGDWAAGYHLVNLLVLYGCMAAILVITRLLTRGPWWLGSVAAVLFMANPVKTEAVLNISGARELLPAMIGLYALLVYPRSLWTPRPWARRLSVAAYVCALLAEPANIMLFGVFIALDYCFGTSAGRWRRLWPITALGLIALAMSGHWALPGALDPARMFVPLYLVLYPIGLLPDTVALFAAWPALGYSVGLLLTVLGVILIRKINNPVFTFGLAGAVVMRLFQGGAAVDPITLAGGGQLLLPVALLAMAAAGFFQAMLDNNHWRPWAVRVSTVACVMAMIVQGWVNVQWIHAGRELRHFLAAAADTLDDAYDGPVALAPDIQYYRMAPMMLSASLRHHTPFGKAGPVIPLMPLSLAPPARISVDAYSPDRAQITVTGLVFPNRTRPPLFTPQWWRHRAEPPQPVTLEHIAHEVPFPNRRIPYPE